MSLKYFIKQSYLEGIISDKIDRLALNTEYDSKELFDKFNKYRQQHKLDINQFNDIESLIAKIDEIESGAAKTKTQYKKAKGISGLTADIDYIEIPMDDSNVQAYIPLNWNASKVIASAKIGGCEGKWCTAYQKDIAYWNKYIHKDDNILVYVLTPEEKSVIQVHEQDLVEVWDQEDNRLSSYPDEIPVEKIHNYVNQNWDIIKSKMLPYYKFLMQVGGIAINQVIDDPYEYLFSPGDGGHYTFNFDPRSFGADHFSVSFEGDHDFVNMEVFIDDYPEILQYFWDRHLAPQIEEELQKQVGSLSGPLTKTIEFNKEGKSLTLHFTEDELLSQLNTFDKIENWTYNTYEQGYIDNYEGNYDPDYINQIDFDIINDNNKKKIKEITGITVGEDDWAKKIDADYDDVLFIIIDALSRGEESGAFKEFQKTIDEYLNNLGFEASDKSNFTWMYTVFAEDKLNVFLGILSEKYWFAPFSDYTDFNENDFNILFMTFDEMEDIELNFADFDEKYFNEVLERRLK